VSDRSKQHRFFVERVPVAAGAMVTLPSDEAHHAVGVLRLKRGAEVELFDGAGRSGHGRIAEVGRRKVTVTLDHVDPPAERPAPRVHLAFAVPKGKRLDWLLEKATELGAGSLRPVVFERSVAGGEELTDAKRRRWTAHCIAAAKQCGLNFLPAIEPMTQLSELPTEARGWCGLVGATAGAARTVPEALADAGERDICVVIGPEGGLTDAEMDELIGAGFSPVRLGRTALRIETAAVALLAAVTAVCERPGG